MKKSVNVISPGTWARAKSNGSLRFVTRQTNEECFEDDGALSGLEPSPFCHYNHYEAIEPPDQPTPPLSAEQVLKQHCHVSEPDLSGMEFIETSTENVLAAMHQFRNQGITLPTDEEIDQMYPLTYLNDGVYLDDHMARAARRGAKEMRDLIQQQLNGK